TDNTVAVVERTVRERGLRGVRIIRQANGGKASALNTGVHATTAPIVVMVDGDTILAPEAIRELVVPFVDPSIGAVSGNTKIGNRRSMLGQWQHIEYVIGFN